MIVISDTTPIISLLKINQLKLLERLFENVMIPVAVYKELTINSAFQKEAQHIKNCSFIEIISVKDRKAVNIFQRVTGLDAGESEAIVLSDELGADILLMDEQKGRKVAKQMGIIITGTIGILLTAYKEEILIFDDVICYMDKLRENGIRISERLYEAVIEKMNADN